MRNKLRRNSQFGHCLFAGMLMFFMLFCLCSTVPVSAESLSVEKQCYSLPDVRSLRSSGVVIGNGAEWRQPRTVVVHTPGTEVLFGLAHPAAALFERPFSLAGAKREHESFICQMADNGIRVIRLTDILLAGTVDAFGNPVPGRELDELRTLAMGSLRYTTEGLPKKLAASQERYRREVVEKLHPRDLLTIILERPVVTLASTGEHNTGLKASYSAGPLMNLYFMRDQVITTARGLVIGHFNSISANRKPRLFVLPTERLV